MSAIAEKTTTKDLILKIKGEIKTLSICQKENKRKFKDCQRKGKTYWLEGVENPQSLKPIITALLHFYHRIRNTRYEYKEPDKFKNSSYYLSYRKKTKELELLL